LQSLGAASAQGHTAGILHAQKAIWTRKFVLAGKFQARREQSTMATQSRQSVPLTSPGYLLPFLTVTALFFIFGSSPI